MAEEQKYLELPALGLPFALGRLYNANKNQIVPAITLWEYEDTNERCKNVEVRRNITCKTDMTTRVSLESKMKSLGVKGNFKISVLANKVEVQGSGEYLNETNTSKTEAKVVLEARGTTKDEFLIMNRFLKENVDLHQELINKIGATHVVVGITYGYQFFLTLKTTCESEEEKRNVQGKIKLQIVVAVEGEVQGSYNTKEEKKLEQLEVNIHGTVQIPTNPTNFQEAMEIYKQLPDLAKDKDCPMTVYLLPLACICSTVPKVCSPIKEDVLSSVTAIFEDISNFEVALSGIQASDIATREPRIQRRAKQLSTVLNGHKIWLQMKLHDIMSDPKMGKDSSESEQILKVLQKHENSPFATKILGIYVSQMEKEVRFMENLVRLLQFSHEDGSNGDRINNEDGKAGRNKITIDICSDETDVATPFHRSDVYVLEIPIIREEDDLLKEMQNYDPDNNERPTLRKAEPLILPLEDENTQRKILKYAKSFVNLTDSKKGDNKNPMKFRCMFKISEKERQPAINKYDALTGEKKLIDPDKL